MQPKRRPYLRCLYKHVYEFNDVGLSILQMTSFPEREYSSNNMTRKVLAFHVILLLSTFNPNTDADTSLKAKLESMVKSDLVKINHVIEKHPGQTMTLLCRNDASKTVKQECPFAEVLWKHNGDYFKLQSMRMYYDIDKLSISSLVPLDSGTYQCDMQAEKGTEVTVAFYSVVIGDLEQRVAYSDTLKLKCNSQVYGYLFNEAIRFWINPNGTVMYERSASVNEEDIYFASSRLAGRWTCFVKDPGTRRQWKTARIKVVIEPVPSIAKIVRIFVKNNKIVSFLILGVVSFVAVLCSNLLIKRMDKEENKFRDEIEHMQEVLGIDITEFQAKDEHDPLLKEDEAESQA